MTFVNEFSNCAPLIKHGEKMLSLNPRISKNLASYGIRSFFVWMFSSLILSTSVFASADQESNDIVTNSVVIHNPPTWLKRPRVEKVIDRIQTKLEWSTRKVSVKWFTSNEEYQKAHSLGPHVRAVAIKGKNSLILIGPDVSDRDFDMVFGHELVHIIIYQKYRGAIPQWLEEGLASHLAKKKAVDYKWLVKQKLPDDIKKLNHSYAGSHQTLLAQYTASQALAELLDKKCGLENLIRLSVERKMEDYIATYCEIKDLNTEFKTWVKKKAASQAL